VTSHGKPVAKIVPFDADANLSARARTVLLTRLRSEPLAHAGRWKREDLYERGK
jgi:antitoxin (DNA-binding transcriptional repressor) of toxin-antitoxin stability system